MYAVRPDGSSYIVQILLAKAARAEEMSLDFCPNVVHSRHQLIASTPYGLAEPSTCSVETRMTSAVILSTTKRNG